MNTLANVALPVAVDSTFTYIIPPELESAAVIGVSGGKKAYVESIAP